MRPLAGGLAVKPSGQRPGDKDEAIAWAPSFLRSSSSGAGFFSMIGLAAAPMTTVELEPYAVILGRLPDQIWFSLEVF